MHKSQIPFAVRLDFIKLVSQAYDIPQKVLVSGITQT